MFDVDDGRRDRRARAREGHARRPAPARRGLTHGGHDPRPASSCAPRPGCAASPSLPGDKSISHRALLFALLADGRDRGSRPRATARTCARRRRAVAALGRHRGARARGGGPGGLPRREPGRRRARRARARSSTAATPGRRPACSPGVLAGRDLFAILDGDASLRRRPMAPRRRAAARDGRRRSRGGEGARCCRSRSPVARRSDPIDYRTPVPSAQVKSAILLAALAADGETR